MAAPAVRVLMRERLTVPQAAARVERLLDVWIRIENALAPEQFDRIEEVASRADRCVISQPYLIPVRNHCPWPIAVWTAPVALLQRDESARRPTDSRP